MSDTTGTRCTQHDREMLRLGGRMVCPACLSAASAPARTVHEAMVDRAAIHSLQLRVQAAGVPAEFAEKSFAEFVCESERSRKLAEFLSTYCASFDAWRHKRKGFLLIGQPGTAKTHLACSMVREIVLGGYRAAYVSLPRLTRDIRAAFGRPRGVDELLRRLIEVEFLVLDEIDLHGTSDADYNMLYDLINSRYEKAGYPTLAISNRPLDHLKRDLDERLVSRILAGTPPIQCDWKPRRDSRLQTGVAQ